MAIGNWGRKITFTVSDQKILTFKNFTRKVSGVWTTHSRAGAKDVSEFIRPGLQTVTFDIELNAMLGVKPRTTLELLERCVESGEYNLLVIGGRRIGTLYWKITNTSEAWDQVLDRGELVKAKVTVTMEEYI